MNSGKKTNDMSLKRLLAFIKPHGQLVTLASIFACLNVALTLFTPILIGRAVDCIGFFADGSDAPSVDFARVPTLTIALALTFICAAIFSWLTAQCVNRLSYRAAADLRNECFSKIHSVPLSYIDANSQGDIVSRMVGDIDIISDGLLQGAAQLLTGIASVAGTMVFMLAQNVIVGIIVIILTPLSIFTASFISKRIHSAFTEQSKITGELGGYADELISNRKLIAAFAYEEASNAAFCEVNGRLKKIGTKAQFYSSLTNPVTRFINSLVFAAAGVAGALLSVNALLLGIAAVSPGQISSFLAYANQYTKPFNEISGVMAQFQSALASAKRVFSVIDALPEVDASARADESTSADAEKIPLTPENCKGEVEMRDVSFSYVQGKPLLKNISLNIPAGSRVAIIGPTGCGKTTLINLLMRFYDINSGAITIDGVDVSKMTRSQTRSMYGMILQDTWLFEGTIRDNIAYSNPDATRDQIESAAKEAHIHNFIMRQPNGYDTVITDEDGSISAGQKQLLCIARVMLAKTPMLILDEATSSIDTMTELRITEAFKTMMQGRTTFIVAHRLSTIKTADIIIAMKDGNIVGTRGCGGRGRGSFFQKDPVQPLKNF